MPLNVNDAQFTIKVVNLSGRVDAFKAKEIRPELIHLIDEGASDLILDISSVEFLDSAGLAVLVAAMKHARSHNGDVRLVKPQADVVIRILELTKFNQVFRMFDTLQEAVASFKS